MSFFTKFKKLIASFQGPRIDEQTNLPNNELRRIAIGNLYIYQQSGTLNTLHTGVDKSILEEILRNWWGIESREDSLETIQYLSTAPSQTMLDYILKAIAMGDEGERYLADNIPTIDMLNKSIAYMENLNNSYKDLIREGIISNQEEVAQLGTLGWDAGRLNFIARASLDYGYISEEECWEVIEYAYNMVKDEFNDWQEFGRSYVLGRSIWSGDTSMTGLLSTLIEEPKSPWSYLSWHD